MGRSGASSGFFSRIPKAERAAIADGRITEFLLDPEKKHHAEFVAVGCSENDPEHLKQDLLKGV